MRKIEDFTNDELLKVLLEAKSLKNGLSKEEQKIDAKLETLSPSRRREIIGALSSKSYIYVDLIFPDNNPNSSFKIMPFTSNEDLDGISEEGIDLINDILRQRKEDKKKLWNEIGFGKIMAILGTIAAIIGAIAAFL